LVGPGLIDVVVRIEGVEARVFLGFQPWQHVEGPRKLLAIPLGAPRGGEADDVAPEAHAPRRDARVVAVVPRVIEHDRLAAGLGGCAATSSARCRWRRSPRRSTCWCPAPCRAR